MTDYKINQDIRNLLKMGLPEDMATIVAYANNGKSEEVQHLVCTIEQEHDLLKKELQNFVPFHEINNTVINIDESDKKDEKSDLQHQQ